MRGLDHLLIPADPSRRRTPAPAGRKNLPSSNSFHFFTRFGAHEGPECRGHAAGGAQRSPTQSSGIPTTSLETDIKDLLISLHKTKITKAKAKSETKQVEQSSLVPFPRNKLPPSSLSF